MGTDRDLKKLNAEELEKRSAPFVIYDEPTDSPTEPIGPGAPTDTPRLNPAGNQMGGSYDHRNDIVNEEGGN